MKTSKFIWLSIILFFALLSIKPFISSKSYINPVRDQVAAKESKLLALRYDKQNSSLDLAFTSKNIDANEQRLQIKYFIAALLADNSKLWVNLDPNESDRILDPELMLTELGRDLLAQDLELKKQTAKLVNHKIEVNNSKVWIKPASIVLHEQINQISIVESNLEVDYTDEKFNLIEKELEYFINNDVSFAPLRKIYNAVILAHWLKSNVTSPITINLADTNVFSGIDHAKASQSNLIYSNYLKSVNEGEFRTIVKEADVYKEYVSGGIELFNYDVTYDQNSSSVTNDNSSLWVRIILKWKKIQSDWRIREDRRMFKEQQDSGYYVSETLGDDQFYFQAKHDYGHILGDDAAIAHLNPSKGQKALFIYSDWNKGKAFNALRLKGFTKIYIRSYTRETRRFYKYLGFREVDNSDYKYNFYIEDGLAQYKRLVSEHPDDYPPVPDGYPSVAMVYDIGSYADMSELESVVADKRPLNKIIASIGSHKFLHQFIPHNPLKMLGKKKEYMALFRGTELVAYIKFVNMDSANNPIDFYVNKYYEKNKVAIKEKLLNDIKELSSSTLGGIDLSTTTAVSGAGERYHDIESISFEIESLN